MMNRVLQIYGTSQKFCNEQQLAYQVISRYFVNGNRVFSLNVNVNRKEKNEGLD